MVSARDREQLITNEQCAFLHNSFNLIAQFHKKMDSKKSFVIIKAQNNKNYWNFVPSNKFSRKLIPVKPFYSELVLSKSFSSKLVNMAQVRTKGFSVLHVHFHENCFEENWFHLTHAVVWRGLVSVGRMPWAPLVGGAKGGPVWIHSRGWKSWMRDCQMNSTRRSLFLKVISNLKRLRIMN